MPPVVDYAASGFLEGSGAEIRNMNWASVNAPAGAWSKMLKGHKDFGFTQVCLYVANEGDGSPVPTTFYKGAWFGEVDMDKVRFMWDMIDEAHGEGFLVEIWCFADDSPSFARATDEQILRHVGLVQSLFGDRVDSICLGLELDEYWGRRWTRLWLNTPRTTVMQRAVDILQESGKPVAVHFTSYKKIDMAKEVGADIFNAQFGWLRSENEMRSRMDWLNARRGGLDIVASEFCKDSTSDLATKLATAAKGRGADGTQTGRPER